LKKWNESMLDKIQSYYGFSVLPFGRNLPPGKLFHSAEHNQAVARIGYGISTCGITVITGEVGVGKTVAARAAIDHVEPARHHLIYIPDPTVGARGIYHHIVAALGGRPSFHNAALVPQARDALSAEAAERGRTPILCIDEGHLLAHDSLEALRLLTNHRLDTESPFATILLGQPTLAAKMALGILAALEQRITVRRTMTGMTREETADYISHHIKLAGRSDPLFTDDAIAHIHQSSRGKPRAINRLAIAALIASAAAGKNLIDDASARTAITETNNDPQPATTP
jgi:type II secretory pathway predicted ATPase ExeA